MDVLLFSVESIKCGGCTKTIETTLNRILGVINVEIDIEENNIKVTHNGTVKKKTISKKLNVLGYPEAGTLEGLSQKIAFTKSFVSCAIGKLNS